MLLNTSNVSIYNVPTNELLFNAETGVAKVTSGHFCQILFVRCMLLGTFECGLHKDMNTRWLE